MKLLFVDLLLSLPLIGAFAMFGLGILLERAVLRPLRPRGSTVQTVGTVALLSLLIAIAAKAWGTAAKSTPNPFPSGTFHIGGGILQSQQIGLFFVAIIVAGIFFA